MLKFQPRASARRGKEERDKIKELEEERNRQRRSEAAAIQKTQQRGNASSRARGATRGRGGMRSGAVAFGGGKRRFDNDSSRASSISRSSSLSRHTPGEGGSGDAYYSSDEDPMSTRIDIDSLNLDDDEDSDEDVKTIKGKRAARGPVSLGPKPVRVTRHEHEERVVSVNTEASSSISAEIRRQTQEEINSDNEVVMSGGSQSQSSQEGKVDVKREPADGDVLMDNVPEHDEMPLPTQTVKARKTVTVKDPRSLLQTREEIEEFDRHVDDLEALKEILTPSQRVSADKPADEPADKADKEATDGDKDEDEKNAGRLFLVQFPPLTPNLVTPGGYEQDIVEIQDDTSDDVTITNENPRAGETKVKLEDGGEDEADKKAGIRANPPGKLVTSTQRQLPAGRVGKLNLHKSGRVTLDWGGISFELDKGARVNFVQEALVATTPQTATDGADDEVGDRCVWAMGPLSEKFIASPEWDKLL